MLGGKNRKPLGYTIVEVMIVLAVSGVMFLIAANFINGKQARTAFAEGVNETASRLQGVIEQVRNGQYSDVNLNCTFDSVSRRVTLSTLSTVSQGTNSPCVFLGKFIYFSYDGAANTTPDYAVYSMTGGRTDRNGNPITTPVAAGATVIDNPSLTIQQVMPQNLIIKKVTINGGTNNYGIGFLQTPAIDSGGALTNGGTTVNMYYLSLPANRGINYVKSIMNLYDQFNINWPKVQTADICLTDGTRYADITLGTTGGQLSVGVQIEGTTALPTCQ